MGYGLVHQKGRELNLITLGVLKLGGYSDHALKLKKIFERTTAIIDEYHPDELAIEAPFYGKNIQSMLKLGRAQGVAMSAALQRSIPIFEYSPKKIKQSITGRGNSSKEQVAGMLIKILGVTEPPEYLDATDGLAAAVCHYFQRGNSQGGSRYSGWKTYISQNPGRLA